MKFHNRHNHVMDIIFPIALFFVFAISALLVLLLSADVYSRNTDDMQLYDEKYTPLAYITEKVRQNDAGGLLSVTEQEGVPCLTLSEDIGGSVYDTYIYVYEGRLKELYVASGTDLSLRDGRDIMVCSGLDIFEIGPGLLRVTITGRDGGKASLIVGERSSQ